MNLRPLTPFALIAAVLLAAAAASIATGAPVADPVPRAASGLALRAL
jgi:hypothetical protein